MKLTKIVITGGPCAGKTTGMEWIKKVFTERGYQVLFIPETATELISSGVAPWTCVSVKEYQRCQLKLQLEKEKVFEYAAGGMDAENILIVCDRGAMDNKAYMEEADFQEIVADMKSSEAELRNRYDAVFHMETAAKAAAEFYTLENNEARFETPEEAVKVDDRLIAAWTGHPHFRIIGSEIDIKGKAQNLISEIASFLGEADLLQEIVSDWKFELKEKGLFTE